MSKVKIEGNASGSGTLTISAPATNTDRSLTLPDGAGEILTDAGLKTINGSSIVGSGDLEVGGGKVLQVVHMTSTSETSTTSTSYVNSVLTANITPSATTSKILILTSTSIYNSQNGFTAITVARNGTNLGHATNGMAYGKDYGSQWMNPASISFIDSPSTTSQITYNIQIRTQESGHTSYLNINSSMGSLVLLEIDGS